MSEKWLEFRVTEPCIHAQDIYEDCPLCTIETLQARINELSEVLTNEGLKTRRELQARIAELETTIAGYKKHFNEPTERDSRMTWQDKYKQAQARIAELESGLKAHELGLVRDETIRLQDDRIKRLDAALADIDEEDDMTKEKAQENGNNKMLEAKCDCGELLAMYSQKVKGSMVLICPKCGASSSYMSIQDWGEINCD